MYTPSISSKSIPASTHKVICAALNAPNALPISVKSFSDKYTSSCKLIFSSGVFILGIDITPCSVPTLYAAITPVPVIPLAFVSVFHGSTT